VAVDVVDGRRSLPVATWNGNDNDDDDDDDGGAREGSS